MRWVSRCQWAAAARGGRRYLSAASTKCSQSSARSVMREGRRIAGHHQLRAPGLLTAVNGQGVCDTTIEEPTLCALNPKRVQHVYGLTHTTLSEPRKYECETAVLS